MRETTFKLAVRGISLLIILIVLWTLGFCARPMSSIKGAGRSAVAPLRGALAQPSREVVSEGWLPAEAEAAVRLAPLRRCAKPA